MKDREVLILRGLRAPAPGAPRPGSIYRPPAPHSTCFPGRSGGISSFKAFICDSETFVKLRPFQGDGSPQRARSSQRKKQEGNVFRVENEKGRGLKCVDRSALVCVAQQSCV